MTAARPRPTLDLAPPGLDPVSRGLVDALLGAALAPCAGPRARRPSLSHDGTRLVLSAKLTHAPGPERLRLLVEPAPLDHDIAAHVEVSFALLDRLLAALGWSATRTAIQEAAGHILPPRPPTALDTLWGGVWLGAVVGGAPEIRVYLDLRHGDATSRWQRLADLAGRWGGAAFLPTFRELLDSLSSMAVPVGIGLEARAGRIAALRVYVGHHEPTPESLATLAHVDPVALRPVLAGHRDRFGPPEPQSVTTGHDLRVDDGRLLPGVRRVKVDVYCPRRRPHDVEDWVDGLPAMLGLPDAELRALRQRMEVWCGGGHTQFVSAGHVQRRLAHLSVYCVPGVA